MAGATAAASALKHESRMSAKGEADAEKRHHPSMVDEPDELGRAGIDPEKMGYLSGRERRLILRRAGLDPDKFDF